MATITVSRNGNDYEIDGVNNEAEANAKLDAALKANPTHAPVDAPSQGPRTITVSRNGNDYEIDGVNNKAEANAKLDAALKANPTHAPVDAPLPSASAIAKHQSGAPLPNGPVDPQDLIHATESQDARDRASRAAWDAAIGTGRSAAKIALLSAKFAKRYPLLNIGDIGASAVAWVRKIWDPNAMTPDEAIDYGLKLLDAPTGKETTAGRAATALGDALAGQGLTSTLDDAVNAGKLATSKTGLIIQELAKKPIAQLAGNVAGAGTTAALQNAGAPEILAQGAGILSNILAARGFANWKDVEKAIAEGKISDPDRLMLLRMAEKYPLLTQSAFPFKPNSVGQFYQNLAEKTPLVGIGQQVAKENAGRDQAAQDMLDTVTQGKPAAQKATDAVQNLVQNRGARVTDMVRQKKDLLAQADAEGTTPINATVENDATQVGAQKVVTDGQGAVDTTAHIVENPEVSNVLSTIQDIKSSLKGAFGTEPFISKLEELRTAVKSGNLQNIEVTRETLRDMLKSPDLSTVSKVAGAQVKRLYSAVSDALSANVRKRLGDDAGNKYDSLNSTLADNMKDFDIPGFKATVQKGAKDPRTSLSLLDYAAENDDPRVVGAIYKDMSPDARHDLADAIAINAFRKAGLGATGDVSEVDAQKFYKALRNIWGPQGVLFTTEQLNRAKATALYLRSQTRNAETPSNPTFGTNLAALANFIPANLFMRIYNSKAVKDMLIRLNDMSEKDPMKLKLARQLNDYVQGQMQDNTVKAAMDAEMKRRKAAWGDDQEAQNAN